MILYDSARNEFGIATNLPANQTYIIKFIPLSLCVVFLRVSSLTDIKSRSYEVMLQRAPLISPI